MRVSLSADELAFEAEVTAFVARHWRQDPRMQGGLLETLGAASPTGERAWFDALVAAGWSVPGWPSAHGGAGWSRTRQFLFARALARAGAPLPQGVGVDLVAPLLMRHGLPHQAPRLEGIRAWTERWCLGIAEPGPADGSGRLLTMAVADGDTVVLTGAKTWVMDGARADWMLCLAMAADGPAWFSVPMHASGVAVTGLPVMGAELALSGVTLSGVRIPAACRLPLEAGRWLAPLPATALAHAAVLARGVNDLRTVLAAQADATQAAELESLAVGVSALEAMEMRLLLEPGAAEGPLRTVAAIRGAELGQALSALRLRAMGYDALPYPDAVRFSNEGMPLDAGILPAVRQALFDRAWTVYADRFATGGTSVEAQRDTLARVVLGFGDPTDR
ncbi:MAG: acyl-CoA dehydrogenase family protein [Pseudomonadales bacterium]|nr:acyl-CoA dehydrogenase family protein [Pseudomonadales bacterium]